MTVELRRRDPVPVVELGCCADCVFVAPGVQNYEPPPDATLACHRFPPSTSLAYPFTKWPIVDAADWCGEFVPAAPSGPSPAPGPDEAFADDLIGKL